MQGEPLYSDQGTLTDLQKNFLRDALRVTGGLRSSQGVDLLCKYYGEQLALLLYEKVTRTDIGAQLSGFCFVYVPAVLGAPGVVCDAMGNGSIAKFASSRNSRGALPFMVKGDRHDLAYYVFFGKCYWIGDISDGYRAAGERSLWVCANSAEAVAEFLRFKQAISAG